MGGEDDRAYVKATDGNFGKKIIKKSMVIPVVVDFWGPRCMPCLILGPVLERISAEYKDKFVLAKLNVDRNPQVSSKYEISAIPAVKFFKQGKVVSEFKGVKTEDEIREWLGRTL